jgi:tetratricopeptide (TPR) repeat protein
MMSNKLKAVLMILMVSFVTPNFGEITPNSEPGTPYENYLKINYFMNLNDFDQAEILIDSFLAKYPKDPFILTEKAFLLQNVNNKPFKAIEILEKVRSIYPEYYYSNYLLASILFTQFTNDKAKVNRAVQLLELSIKDNDRYFDSFYLLGIIKSERKEYRLSNRYFEKANRLEQKLATYYYMSSNYRELKDRKGEIATYEKILNMDPANFKALETLSQMYMEQENYKKAAHYLGKLFSFNPGTRKIAVEYLYSLFAAGESEKFLKVSNLMDIGDSSILIYARALLLSRSQKLDDALELLDSNKSKDVRTNLLLADIYLRKHDYYKSLRTLERVNLQNRGYPYYTLMLQTYLSLNLNRRIINLFNGVIRKSPVLEELTLSDYYTVFYAYANLNRLEELKEVVKFTQQTIKNPSSILNDLAQRLNEFSPEKVIRVDEESLKFQSNLFLLFTFPKNHKLYEPAIAFLKHLIGFHKEKSPSAHLELYDIYLRQEQFPEAEKGLKQLQKLFPKSSSVKNFYAYYLAMQGKQLEEALKISAKTIAKDPDNPAYIDTYGYILFKMGRLGEAEAILEKAFNKHPFEEEIMEHLVDCYRIRRKFPEIIEIYKRAIQYNVDFANKLQKELKKMQQLR